MSQRDCLPDAKTAGLVIAFFLFAVLGARFLQSDLFGDSLHEVLETAKSSDNNWNARSADANSKGNGPQNLSSAAATCGDVQSASSDSSEKKREQREKEDLDAQRRMATAAERTVILTAVQTIIGIVGTACVIAALIWTIRGTKSALTQAAAAIESNSLARAAHLADMRPWITVKATVAGPLYYNLNGLHVKLAFDVTNIGKSPATFVWPHATIVAPAIGVDGAINLQAAQQKAVASILNAPPNSYGMIVFPGETTRQVHVLNVPADEVKRLTSKVGFVFLTIIATVEYGFDLDKSRHLTGLMLEVKRSGSPRPISIEKKRAPDAIFPDEGDIPAEEVRLYKSYGGEFAT